MCIRDRLCVSPLSDSARNSTVMPASYVLGTAYTSNETVISFAFTSATDVPKSAVSAFCSFRMLSTCQAMPLICRLTLSVTLLMEWLRLV